MKLELKHIAPYLPYELKVLDEKGEPDDNIFILESVSIHEMVSDNHGNIEILFTEIKPILRPLSDLTKEIEVNGEEFVPMKKILKEVGLNYPQECYNQDEAWVLNDGYRALGEFSYRKIQLLLKWHFDVFGLIEQGLAIDINTL